MNKRKIALLAMSLCMVAVLAVGGTLAYFTDTDKAENTFTMGNVKIEQNEYQRVMDDKGNKLNSPSPEAFAQNKQLFPYSDVVKDSTLTMGDYTFDIRSGKTYVDKLVTVKNTGSEDAYVRTWIAIPSLGNDADGNAANNILHWNGLSDTDTTPNNGWFWGKEDGMEWPGNSGLDNWNAVYGVDLFNDGFTYDVYVATNMNVIAENEETSPSLVGIYLDKAVDYITVEDDKATDEDESYEGYVFGNVRLGDISELKIYAFTEAVQAEGFADAWEAFKKSFGAVSEETLPW